VHSSIKHIALLTHTSISWSWIPVGSIFFVVKNGIAELTSQSVRSMIDIVLYKALWQQTIHSMIWGHCRVWRQLSKFKELLSMHKVGKHFLLLNWPSYIHIYAYSTISHTQNIVNY
jgi:hypothetical protein